MKLKLAAIAFILIVTNLKTNGQDRSFANTYQSLVLNKGQIDFEVWNTYRTGRSELYRRLDQRLEFEIGLTTKLQTAFYLNRSQKTYQDSTTLITEPAEISFSNEWKIKLSDPVANAIGTALYAEASIASNEYELELKLILDKKINKHLIAFNAVGEWEFKPELKTEGEITALESEIEFKPELYLGYQYFIKTNFGIGIEAANKMVMIEGKMEHSALFAGPTFSYSAQNWWIIFNASPQIISVKEQESGSLDLNEFEKHQFRLLFSYMF